MLRFRPSSTLGLLLISATVAFPASAAEVAFLYSTYQEKQFAYMPGEYAGQYATAGDQIKAAGFPWDRVDSAAVEAGALVQKGYKALIISYTSTMSPAEAVAITDFVRRGGKVFAIYSSLNVPWTAAGPGQPGRGLLADVLGMESADTIEGARCMRAEKADHPLLSLLPPDVFNPHGYAVRMRALPGTQVIATWAADEQGAADPASGAILVSPTAVYFSGYLWRLPEAKIIVANALNVLLNRPVATVTALWTPVKQAPAVVNGIDLTYVSDAKQDVDAVGWETGRAKNGIRQPTCAVVYPVSAPEVYFHAKRLARALSCPLVSDRAAIRDQLSHDHDLLVVGRLFKDRCENPLGNTLLGIRSVLSQYASQPGKAVIRVAPADARPEARRLLLVAGTDFDGLTRAEELVRTSVRFDPGAAPRRLLLWQPRSAFGDLVYPWTPAGGPITELQLPAAVNQQARAQFVVTAPMGSAPIDLDLQLSPLQGPAGTFPAERVRLLLTRYVKSNISKIDEPHPLVPGTHFSLEPAQHQQVWLIADCAGVQPGRYTSKLTVQGHNGPLAELAVSLDVAPITLAPANRHRKLTCVWDYAISGHLHGDYLSRSTGTKLTPEDANSMRWGKHYEQHFRNHWRAYVDDLEAHGVNVMFLSPTAVLPQYQEGGQQLDAGHLAPLVSYGRQHGFRLFVFTQILGQGCYYPDSDVIAGAAAPYGSPAWDEAYCKVVRAYVEFARQQGLDYSQWAIYPFDEPHCAHDRDLINHVAALVARVDPKIQVWEDPMRGEGSVTGVDFWKSIAKATSIFWPAEGYIPMGSDSLRYLQGLGKPFGFYRCSAYDTKDRSSVRPDSYYRLFGWQVERLGASGMGFWTWLAWLGDSWNDEDSPSRDGDGAVVYEGPTGPITTNDWEAWGEGLDDYKYLEALDAAIAARQKRLGEGDAQCQEAHKLRAEAVETVCKDIRQADAERAKVRAMILKLR